MTVERVVRAMAGSMVLLSVVLVYFVSNAWLLLTVFVGLNLLQSAFTGICPAENIARKLGAKSAGGKCCS